MTVLSLWGGMPRVQHAYSSEPTAVYSSINPVGIRTFHLYFYAFHFHSRPTRTADRHPPNHRQVATRRGVDTDDNALPVTVPVPVSWDRKLGNQGARGL